MINVMHGEWGRGEIHVYVEETSYEPEDGMVLRSELTAIAENMHYDQDVVIYGLSDDNVMFTHINLLDVLALCESIVADINKKHRKEHVGIGLSVFEIDGQVVITTYPIVDAVNSKTRKQR